jgi:hypothetical protein
LQGRFEVPASAVSLATSTKARRVARIAALHDAEALYMLVSPSFRLKSADSEDPSRHEEVRFCYSPGAPLSGFLESNGLAAS